MTMNADLSISRYLLVYAVHPSYTSFVRSIHSRRQLSRIHAVFRHIFRCDGCTIGRDLLACMREGVDLWTAPQNAPNSTELLKYTSYTCMSSDVHAAEVFGRIFLYCVHTGNKSACGKFLSTTRPSHSTIHADTQ
jgi:hypothetical protein